MKFLDGHKKFLDKTTPDSLAHHRIGQTPEVLFITCSDSRVDPGKILESDFGEVFVIRNAGNLVPAQDAITGGEAATIEYAVKALKIKHIVVCGHTHCGAMGGLLNPDALGELPLVAEWLNHAADTKKAVDKLSIDDDGELLSACVRQNVLVQIENLNSYPAVKSAVEDGDLEIHGWVYDIGSGRVIAYDSESEEFSALVQEEKV